MINQDYSKWIWSYYKLGWSWQYYSLWVPENTKNKYVPSSQYQFSVGCHDQPRLWYLRAPAGTSTKRKTSRTPHTCRPAGDDKQGGSRQTSIGIHRTITITNGNYAFNDRVICTTRWMKSKGRGRRAAGRLASEYTGQEQVATRTKQDALNDTAICATWWMKVNGRGRPV